MTRTTARFLVAIAIVLTLIHFKVGNDSNDGNERSRKAVNENNDIFVESNFATPCLHFRNANFTKFEYIPQCGEHRLGNQLAEIYSRRVLAAAAGIPFEFKCHGVMDSGSPPLILNLIQREGTEPEKLPIKHNERFGVDDFCDICRATNFECRGGTGLALEMIREDVRSIADKEADSFVPDDAVIHLRLGDALAGTYDNGLGLLPRATYAALIKETEKEKGNIETISIVTIPFKRKLTREFDSHHRHRTQIIAEDLLAYLREEFPKAKVKIHNDKDETTMRVFARLARAKKVAICGLSTLCTWPVLAVGPDTIGYIYESNTQNPWAHADKYIKGIPNVRSYKSRRLPNHRVKQSTDEEMMDWIRNEPPFGPVCSRELDATLGCRE